MVKRPTATNPDFFAINHQLSTINLIPQWLDSATTFIVSRKAAR